MQLVKVLQKNYDFHLLMSISHKLNYTSNYKNGKLKLISQFSNFPNFPTLNYLKTFSKNILKKLLPFQKIVVLLHDIL